jgi:sugar phosphate isomerase/epimerase
MNLLLCVQTPEVSTRSPISLLNGTFEEMLSKASKWGADGFELMPVEPSKVDVVAINTNMGAHQLTVGAIGTALLAIVAGLTLLNPDVTIADKALTYLYKCIDLAAGLSAPLVTIGGFRGRFSSFGTQGRQQLVFILREAAAYAEHRSVRLALEPVNHYQLDGIISAEDGLTFLEEVNHPTLGLVLDTCHMTMEENSWTEPFRLVMSAGKLWHVHLAENNRMAPGHGLIDFQAILSTLYDIGYSGYLSIEVIAKPDADISAQEGLSYIRTLLSHM